MKDYYRILGVLDDAEDIIIRAAYKALAQKYHPDKWKGESSEATQKMSAINEAYDILSNLEKKQRYDEEFFRNHARDESYEDDDSNANFISEEDETWQMAIDFYPIILQEFNELQKISHILANTYKTNLINSQDFKQSTKVKIKYEKDYLDRFYGSNNQIKEFAKKLLLNNHKAAAIKINKIVRLMGDSVDFIQMYEKIIQEFPGVVSNQNTSTASKASQASTEYSNKDYDNHFHEICKKAKLTNLTESEAIYLLRKIFGVEVRVSSFGWSNKYIFRIDNDRFSLSIGELRKFLREHV